jgi:hypothetical protein
MLAFVACCVCLVRVCLLSKVISVGALVSASSPVKSITLEARVTSASCTCTLVVASGLSGTTTGVNLFRCLRAETARRVALTVLPESAGGTELLRSAKWVKRLTVAT